MLAPQTKETADTPMSNSPKAAAAAAADRCAASEASSFSSHAHLSLFSKHLSSSTHPSALPLFSTSPLILSSALPPSLYPSPSPRPPLLLLIFIQQSYLSEAFFSNFYSSATNSQLLACTTFLSHTDLMRCEYSMF